jgi:hypothetical protein
MLVVVTIATTSSKEFETLDPVPVTVFRST